MRHLKHPATWLILTTASVLIAFALSPLGWEAETPEVAAQSPQAKPILDVAGNTVQEGARRFNYLMGETGSTRIELDAQGRGVVQQDHPGSSSATAKMVAPAGAFRGPSVLGIGGSNPSLLELEWKYGLYGSGIGESRIVVFDIDDDGTLEALMGGSSGGGFGSDDFWYVVKRTGPDTYIQVWFSDLYTASVNRIAVADVNEDDVGEIYVGLSDGRVSVYDGRSLAETGSFTAGGGVAALVVADADGDGEREVVTSDGSRIYVYSALPPFALEWASTAYGGGSLAVGNVDFDIAPEIVTAGGHGYVLDGTSHALEWDYAAGFGSRVEVGELDSDGIAEIVGAASWYTITAFDAELRSPKWQISTSLDIAALRVTDIDANGVAEILYGDGQWGSIHCYDGTTQRWAIGNPEHGVTDIALGDVNRDGTLEVLWGAGATSTGPDFLYVADTATRSIEWQSIHLDGPLSAVDAGDVDDDGRNEIVMVSYESNNGYNDGIIHIFDAVTHNLEWRSADLPGIIAWSGVNSLKIGDVDGDGRTEFVIATANTYDGLIQIYDGQTHTLERQSPTSGGASFTALAIGDVDNDGQTEIVVGQEREHTGATGVYLLVFDGATATEEWRSTGLDTSWGYVYDIDLEDCDNDGHPEMIASVAGEHIYVYDGVTHQLDWFSTLSAYALETLDSDADSEKEILVGTGAGTVEVYSGSTFVLEASFNLGSGAIKSLLIDDINQDWHPEWLIGESANLSIFSDTTKSLIWRNDNMGDSPGQFNHIVSSDIDESGAKEIVIGSRFALYQFGADAVKWQRVYAPIVLRNLCMPMYYDDFSRPESGWPTGDTPDSLLEYVAGEYRILTKSPRSMTLAGPGIAVPDYAVSTSVRNASSVYGTYGLLFAASGTWDQFYSFEISPGGGYALYRYDAGHWTVLASGLSEYIKLGLSTNQLRVERNGSLIRAYVNRHLLANVSDASFTGLRYVGLIVSTRDQPNVDARFDNFAVYPSSCSETTSAGGEVDMATMDMDSPGDWKSVSR
jgi:hypothetical protein